MNQSTRRRGVASRTAKIASLVALSVLSPLGVGTASGGFLATSGVVQPAAVAPEFDCPPEDEARRDPSLVAFRAKLRKAVARRDAAGVLAVTHPGIRTSFGPDDGLKFFKRDLADRHSEVWDELAAVLALGGRFETPDTFVAPFSFGCGEPGEEVVVVGRDVHVRSRPEARAPILSSVSFAILRRTDDASARHWEPVQLPDGRRGFIAARFVRSPIGYRAYFTKVDGVWRLVSFIGGN